MSKLKFSGGKFSRFITSKGFYVAIAVCLVGAGAATWMAVDRTISDIESSNSKIIESENQFTAFPSLEEAEKKQEDVKQTPRQESSASSKQPEQGSSSAASATQQEPAVKPEVKSEQPAASKTLPTLSYNLPVKDSIVNQYSNGELVKNTTLGDWRTHDGVDITADKGTEVLAAADGVIFAVTSDPLWGTMISIDHPDGRRTIYCGLENVVPVKPGDNVAARQVIGKVDGVPCEINDPNHMHFAMKLDGAYVDPLSVMQKAVG